MNTPGADAIGHRATCEVGHGKSTTTTGARPLPASRTCPVLWLWGPSWRLPARPDDGLGPRSRWSLLRQLQGHSRTAMDGVRAMKETPTLNRMGETITLDFPEQMIHIQLDRWGDNRGDVTAEITVHVSAPGLPIDLHQSRVNLSSLGQREKLARILTGRYKGPDWTEIVEQIARQALAVRREGDPAINLAEQPADLRLAYRLESYVPEDGSTVLAADGGAGKSTLALFLCAAVGTGTPFLGLATRAGRVAFLDYETSARQQARRLRLIACGLELSEIPPVIYRHLDVPLPQCAPELRRFFQTERIDFAVLDSLGLAGGSQPDAEPTLAVFRVINSLQRPVLVCSITPTGAARFTVLCTSGTAPDP